MRLSGSTRWPLYFLAAHAACRPLSPRAYASINRRERLANLVFWSKHWQIRSDSSLTDVLSHWFDWDGIQTFQSIDLELILFWGLGPHPVEPLCISPALFNEIEFAMELWKENNLKASRFTKNLEIRFALLEIGLRIKLPPYTTICCSFQSILSEISLILSVNLYLLSQFCPFKADFCPNWLQ